MKTRTLWLAGALIGFGPAVFAADPAAAPATPTAAAAGQNYTLQYKFKQANVNYYKMTLDSNGTLSGPGGTPIPIVIHAVFFYHQTVTAVSTTDGVATLTTKFDSADISSTMAGQAIGDPTIADKLKSRVLTSTVSPTGKTTVKPDGDDAAATLGMDFSKMATPQGTAVLPDAPIKVGDSWKNPVDLGGTTGGQISGILATVKSTLASMDTAADKKVVTINQTTTGEAKPSDATAVGMSVAGKVDGTGVLKFDTDAGVVLSQKATTSLNLTLTPKGDAGAAGGAGPIPVQFTITTDLEKVDASAVPKATPATPAAPAATSAPAVVAH